MPTRAALSLALMLTGTAAAAQSVSAAFPETLVTALQDLGYRAVLETDSVGDPQVSSSINGLNYIILFYGCTDNAGCRDLQFRASFETEGSVTRDQLHDWNRDYLVGKAYISEANNTVIEHAIMGVDGMSRTTFERVLDRWESALTSFTDFIAW